MAHSIVYFLHCAHCQQNRPDGVSAKQWARSEIGLTAEGAIQVWCLRCDQEIALINNLPALAKRILNTGCMKHPHN